MRPALEDSQISTANPSTVDPENGDGHLRPVGQDQPEAAGPGRKESERPDHVHGAIGVARRGYSHRYAVRL